MRKRVAGKRGLSDPPEGSGSAEPAYVRRVPGGIELALKVVPGASRSAIAGPLGNRLKVRVAEPPEGGRANRAVVELLKEWLGVRDVEIVGGLGSAEKTARVGGVNGLTEQQRRRFAGEGSAARDPIRS